MRKILAAALALAALQALVTAETPRMQLEPRWSYGTGAGIGDIAIGNVYGDGKDMVVVGFSNNTVVILDRMGVKKSGFFLGNATQIGGIYSMAAADIDGDGVDELIFGLGGAREVRTYTQNDFDVDPLTGAISSKDKVLYRVVRNHGGIYVLSPDGTIRWRYLTDDSVKSVAYLNKSDGSGYIAAAVGDSTTYTYNERSTDPIPGWSCTYANVTDEPAGYTTKVDCNRQACTGLQRCVAKWDDEDEVCLRDYEKASCGYNQIDIVGWHNVDYVVQNGSVYFLDKDGKFKAQYGIQMKDEDKNIVPNADNTIREVLVADLDGKGENNLLVASSNGGVYALNVSNFSAIHEKWSAREEWLVKTSRATDKVLQEYGIELRGLAAEDINKDGTKEVITGNGRGLITAYGYDGKSVWRQRIDDAVTSINTEDVELDGYREVLIASLDGNIYAYDFAGNVKWTYPSGSRIYGLRVGDLDHNDQKDFLVYTEKNVTRLETSEYYLKEFRADAFYNLAESNFMGGDYTNASVYIDRAIELYTSIGKRDRLPKCNLLRARIDSELKLVQLKEADRLYNLALKYYSINDFDNAFSNANDAREIYKRIDSIEGMNKCDTLVETIKEETRAHRKIEADGLYNKALSLITFGNYTGAIDLIDAAKKTYTELGFYNDTVQCDIQLIRIADRYYTMAISAYQSKDYVKSLEYAELAGALYTKANSVDASLNAAELARKARQGIEMGPQTSTETDYKPYLIGVIVLLVFAIIYLRVRGTGGGRNAPAIRKADEEIEAMEKEG
jgi:tetratricopeptide (TPR) repeat protein